MANIDGVVSSQLCPVRVIAEMAVLEKNEEGAPFILTRIELLYELLPIYMLICRTTTRISQITMIPKSTLLVVGLLACQHMTTPAQARDIPPNLQSFYDTVKVSRVRSTGTLHIRLANIWRKPHALAPSEPASKTATETVRRLQPYPISPIPRTQSNHETLQQRVSPTAAITKA